MSKPYIDLGSWKPGQLSTGTGMSEEMWKVTGNLMMIRADQYFADQRQLNDLKAENARLTAQVAAGQQRSSVHYLLEFLRYFGEKTGQDTHKLGTYASMFDIERDAASRAAGALYDAATALADAQYDEDDALTAYAEDMGAPADAEPMNAMNAHSEPSNTYAHHERIEQHEQRLDELAARMDEEAAYGSIRLQKLEADGEAVIKRLHALESSRQPQDGEIDFVPHDDNPDAVYQLFSVEHVQRLAVDVPVLRKRLDELAARVDFLHSDTDKRLIPLESPSLASELGSRSVFEIAKINSQFNKLHYRIEKLEAARQEPPQAMSPQQLEEIYAKIFRPEISTQPQPTPSAPVTRVLEAAERVTFTSPTYDDNEETIPVRKDVFLVLRAAVSALRDREGR